VKPLLLDLFSGAGGSARGYYDAGFEVVGVDHKPQKNYPYDFIQQDAFWVLYELQQGNAVGGYDLTDFAAIHASPPCQAYTQANNFHGYEHPDLVGKVREALKRTNKPWVIENVVQAPMRRDAILCGSMFGLEYNDYGLQRHRAFEFHKPTLILPPLCKHKHKSISVFGNGGKCYNTVECWQKLMQIDWMDRQELAQAIPPAYTRYIGNPLRGYAK
jgi:DNA (cytosine-5)-methyltransferase 1